MIGSEIISHWEKLESYYTFVYGFSKRKVRILISKAYNLSLSTVNYHLSPDYRNNIKVYYKAHQAEIIRYRKENSSRLKEYMSTYLPIYRPKYRSNNLQKIRDYDRTYKRLYRHLPAFLNNIFPNKKLFTLQEATDKIYETKGIKINVSTLENILNKQQNNQPTIRQDNTGFYYVESG